jgi:hypothetical protein
MYTRGLSSSGSILSHSDSSPSSKAWASARSSGEKSSELVCVAADEVCVEEGAASGLIVLTKFEMDCMLLGRLCSGWIERGRR